MRNLAFLINDIYLPSKALIIYANTINEDFYVECFDMDDNGLPINAHPLSVIESNKLAKTLDTIDDFEQGYLSCKALLPRNVLHLNTMRNGFAIWYTPAMPVNLYFKNDLGIDDGIAYLPPLVWKGSKEGLYVYAIAKNQLPTLDTPLCYAPFFNIYEDGKVCMGNVNVSFDNIASLEEFMAQWQALFFNSKFSHLLRDVSPVSQNIVQLWQNLIGKEQPFPVKSLKKNDQTLKNLL